MLGASDASEYHTNLRASMPCTASQTARYNSCINIQTFIFMNMTLLTPAPCASECALPLYLHRAACGFPSPASDYVEGGLDLNRHCIHHPAATFYLRAEGDSMTGLGIFPGDLLVVDKSLTPRQGDVVIALLDGGFTVKTLQLTPHVRLLPANPAFAPIDFPVDAVGEQGLEIFGVVTHVVGNLRQRDGHCAG